MDVYEGFIATNFNNLHQKCSWTDKNQQQQRQHLINVIKNQTAWTNYSNN